MSTHFKERQRFTQWWLWLILIGIGILPILAIYTKLIIGTDFGTNPMSNWGVVLFSLLIFGIIGLFLIMKLKTEINANGIRMNFFPFIKKTVSWKEIKSVKVISYGFVGGWGIRFGTRYGTVYNIKGNKGLALELKNGKRFLIGTQKEKELKSFIDAIKNLGNDL